MIGKLVLALLVVGCVSAGSAEEYWVTWEGNDFPENEGWERDLWGPEPIRILEDGMMTLDTRETIALWDAYKMYRSLDPGPGEVFLLQWRIRVDEVTGGTDPGLWLKTDNYRSIDFYLGIDHVDLPGFVTIAEFEPWVFHTFEFRSSDMETFEFRLDGILTYEGTLLPSGYSSTVGWGDIVYGASSLATWDYVRFGIVPEPGAGLLLGFAGLAGSTRRILA